MNSFAPNQTHVGGREISSASSRHSATDGDHKDAFKLSRSAVFVGGEFGLDEIARPSTTSGMKNTHLLPIGHNAEDRILRRAIRSASPPSELAVREILKTPNYRHRSATNDLTQLSSEAREDVRQVRSSHLKQKRLLDSRCRDSAQRSLSPENSLSSSTGRIPNARLGAEVQMDSSAILGSSQLVGCQGDFCHFDIHSIDSKAPMSRKTTKSKRGAASNKIDYQKALFQAGLLDNSLDFGRDAASTEANYKISYKSIIQARQEMPLVKLQLERHVRGEDGPYMMEETFQDVAVKGKLPAHYYQEVPVCANCFQVYSIVDTARAKAVKNIEAKIDERKQARLSSRQQNSVTHTGTGTGEDVGTSSSAVEQWQNHTEEEEDDELHNLDKEELREAFHENLTKHQQAQLAQLQPSSRRRAYTTPVNDASLLSDSLSLPTHSSSITSSPTKSSKKKDNAAEKANLQAALEAIDGLTKMDVAEIRTMVKPPAAVEVVIEAVMILLTGKYLSFKESFRLLSGGEAFLVMLKDFQLSDVTDERLKMVEVYVDNPLFRPENVLPVSYCASKFCAWVHGIVHAARYQRGRTHQRTDSIQAVAKTVRALDQPMIGSQPSSSYASYYGNQVNKNYLKPLKKPTTVSAPPSRLIANSSLGTPQEELSFVQKLEKMKANKVKDIGRISREGALSNSLKGSSGSLKKQPLSTLSQAQTQLDGEPSQNLSRDLLSRSTHRLDPRPSPSLLDVSVTSLDPPSNSHNSNNSNNNDKKKLSKRDLKAMKAMQEKATDRLSAQTAMEGSVGVVGLPKEFRCADGLTTMPYVVMGKFSLHVERCNFVVFHDFFDTYDGTAILFKPIVQRHEEGCQVFCFNYPGQAHTTWPRPTATERERGAKEAVLNNDFIADRVHEMLSFAEAAGDMLLSRPFHLVGIGNGACIAAAFAQRYGQHPLYKKSLRSVVSVNGFLYPDAQLASILHAAQQVFSSTPHSRPDIAVSYWSRFIFSEEYLRRVNPNLALNIYTAVSNPITNDGRAKITRGCLAHKDMRGALSPDIGPIRNPANYGSSTSGGNANNDTALSTTSITTGGSFSSKFVPLQVPVVVLQSTEDTLVNASNVDAFLVGRTSKHLWSHMLNRPSDALKSQSFDVNAQWVGKMSHSPEDYLKYSTLGKTGAKMLLDSLRSPRGAFVMWVRAGHIVQQEQKAAFLDLLDALACPTDEYLGMDVVASSTVAANAETSKNALTSFGVVVEDPLPAPIVLKLHTSETSKEKKEEKEKEKDKESTGETSAPLPMDIDKTIDNILQRAIPQRPPTSFASVKEEETETRDNDSNEEAESVKEQDMSREEVEKEVVDDSMHASFDNNNNTRKKESGDKPAEQSIAAVALSTDSVVLPDSSSFSPSMSRHPSLSISSSSSFSPERTRTKENTKEKEREKSAFWKNPEIVSHRPSPHTQDSDTAKPTTTTTKAITAANANDIDSQMDQFVSSHAQRSQQSWVSTVPDLATALALEAELREKQREYQELEAKLKAMREQVQAQAQETPSAPPQQKKKEKERERDEQRLQSLSAELELRQKEREFSERERRLQAQEIEDKLVQAGLVPPLTSTADERATAAPVSVSVSASVPVRELPPMHYSSPEPLPKIITENKDTVSKLDQMLSDEREAKKRGVMRIDDFDRIKRQMAERQLERDQRLRHLSEEELHIVQNESAIMIQSIVRGFLGRRRYKRLDALRRLEREQRRRVVYIQAAVRGFLGRRRYKRLRGIYLQNMKGYFAATEIQRIYRGYADRGVFRRRRRHQCAIIIQRVFRGHLARKAARRERQRLALLRKKHNAATKIQSLWRMKVAKEEFRSVRIHMLAAIEIQRVFRGYLGRKRMARKRLWESTKPGPERIKLGLQFIEESKQAFERQQEEIDALHRAQERAEARVSHIHAELRESEKELVVLERELQEIDQIERDLNVLTHERHIITQGIEDAAGMPRTAAPGHGELVLGHASNNANDPLLDRRRRAEAYALEMTIQMKRAEREKKRQELEIEFAAVFQEVEKKKRALQRLELSLADMEATRERKDREFKRLQKNLMQLLLEQKQELDELREKGLELETATATTAAAAVATAHKAKEHEKRSNAMFSQTEELMKFQFMSMSLSYFSSLNMLKSLREMNADTTSAAIALSAEASSTAAAAASAANLPSVKKLTLGANDFVEASIRKKKEELAASEKAKKEFKIAAETPMPANVRTWTVSDVARWLESLSLSQYIPAFTEGSVDGPFLMELREDDLIQVLNIKHKLHVRKILVSREKLKPLNQQEQFKKEFVEKEEQAGAIRQEMGVPSLDAVFSQARNGRIKRVEESLNLGFPIDAEDEKGNTLLLVACQNRNKRLVEMLLLRGASINHQNALGNTALHYAIAFDTDGVLGEYLIERGADDSIENINGLTPYDGCA